MPIAPDQLDFSKAVDYHYDKFPPKALDITRLLGPLTTAAAALARYDQMLLTMHNSEILMAPLRGQEAVISSRMEGTIATLDEVLQYEAEQDEDGHAVRKPVRSETLEVFSYQLALRQSQEAMKQGAPISEWLIRNAHGTLLRFGRGAEKRPGVLKTEQNYVAERNRREILFVPIKPERLGDGLKALFNYINDDTQVELLKTAISHIEFEALHPFSDGNGRIGRMLVTLLLWQYGVISHPHFYVSDYLEEVREEYIERMRAVSENDEWTEWCLFFLNALTQQANRNMEKTKSIAALYEQMKGEFRDALASSYTLNALDFIFTTPIFKNSRFTNRSGIPKPTAIRLARVLVDRGLLDVLDPASGRRSATLAFEPLLKLVRG